MKFDFATSKDIDSLKELWHIVFGDDLSYIDFFFQNCYPFSRAVVAKNDENKVIAMLFLIPSKALIDGKEHKTEYIYAVGTHPDYRKRGISGELLSFTHKALKNEGALFSYLRPAEQSLFGFYEKYGYKTLFGMDELDFIGDLSNAELLVTTSLPEMQQSILDFVKDKELAVIWDKQMLCYIEKELNGETLRLEDNSAFGVCYNYGDYYFVKELHSKTKTDRLRLLASIKKHFGKEIKYREPSTNPFVMAFSYTEHSFEDIQNYYIGLVLDA